MLSKNLLRFCIILMVLSFVIAVPAVAQGPVDADLGGSDVDSSSEDATPNEDAPVDVAPVESSVEDSAVDTPADGEAEGEDADGAPAESDVDELGIEENDPIGAGPGGDVDGDEVEAADVVNPNDVLGGSFSTDVIAVANTGDADGTGTINFMPVKGTAGSQADINVSVVKQGVDFYAPSSEGEFSGILQTDFAAQVAVLTTNKTEKTGDIYTGFDANAVAQTLYGAIVYKDNANWTSLIYCQNAHSAAQEVTAELYSAGSTTADATLKETLEPGQTVKWNVKTDATTWSSDKTGFGYAKFSGAAGNVACVVDGQNNVDKWNSAYSAVSTAYAANKLNVPLVYNAHGIAPATGGNGDTRGRASLINTGFAVINVGSTDTTAKVTFIATNLKDDGRSNYTVECTQTLSPGQSGNWFIPAVWNSGFGGQWACTENNNGTTNSNYPLTYEFRYNSFGTVIVEGENLLGIANHNQQDKYSAADNSIIDNPATMAFSSLGVPNSKATENVVCPLIYNPDDPTVSFASGIRVANVGTASVQATITVVPKGGGAGVTFTNDIAAGEGATNSLPQVTEVPKGLEGAAFISAPAGSTIIAASNALNGGASDSAATQAGVMYDCVNY